MDHTIKRVKCGGLQVQPALAYSHKKSAHSSHSSRNTSKHRKVISSHSSRNTDSSEAETQPQSHRAGRLSGHRL